MIKKEIKEKEIRIEEIKNKLEENGKAVLYHQKTLTELEVLQENLEGDLKKAKNSLQNLIDNAKEKEISLKVDSKEENISFETEEFETEED